MPETWPEFDDPPVVETVMSVQFAPLPNFSTLHAGWYWGTCLRSDGWTRADQADPLDDQFERFGEETAWERPGVRVRVVPGTTTPRLQIIERNEERMIQLQSTRFIYNWRKRGSEYPTYKKLRPEFDKYFAQYEKFVADAGFGAVEPNQWEMTYVNHIGKQELWSTPEDWAKVLPGFYFPVRDFSRQRFESFGGEWHLVIEPSRGRLHVAVLHGRVGSGDGPEVLIVKLTARGPIDEKKGSDLSSGFELGHETIVRSFVAMTSEAAHKHWHRTR